MMACFPRRMKNTNRNRFAGKLPALLCGFKGIIAFWFLYAATSITISLEFSMLQVPGVAPVAGFNCDSLLQERTNRESVCRRVYDAEAEDSLSTHLKVILGLFETGVEIGMLVEANYTSQVSEFEQLANYLAVAPPGWEALQLHTSNGFVSRQGTLLSDPWLPWFPDHLGTSIYLLNRKGMHKILVASSLLTRRSLHEILFSYVTTYTLASRSTVQPNYPPGYLAHPRKVAVLESILIRSLLDLDTEIKWLSEDYGCLKLVEPGAEWVIRVVVSTEDLLSECETRFFQLRNRGSFHFSLQVRSGQFNKFEIAQQQSKVLANYQYVLLKDSDQRLCGFPWKSFVSRIGDAVIAGPLRQSVNEHLSSNKGDNIRQWFKLHDGHMWKSNEYTPNEFAEAVPLRVSFLEQYFVVMQGSFSSWFFSILPDSFFHQSSSWGIDTVWCGAASSYASTHHPCSLIPLISLHEDKMSYLKDRNVNLRGTTALYESTRYKIWKNYSEKNIHFAGGRSASEVWDRCSDYGYPGSRNLSHCLLNLL